MPEALIFARILLVVAGAVSVVVAIRLFKPPPAVMSRALRLCWTAGALNLAVDILQQHFGFWHYTLSGLVLGLPLDLYVAVSFFIGGTLCLAFWWVATHHSTWIIPLLAILPCYLLLQDYVAISATGTNVIALESPSWWIADFFSLALILYGTLFVFHHFSHRDRG